MRGMSAWPPQLPESQIQMQANNGSIAPAAPAMAPVTPAVAPVVAPTVAPAVAPTAPAPAAPVATSFVAILAKLEDSRDLHVCPFSLSEELLFREDATGACSYRKPVIGPCPVVSAIPQAGSAVARSPDPPYCRMAGNRRLACPGGTGDSGQPSRHACSWFKDRSRTYFRKRANGSSPEPGVVTVNDGPVFA
jgi:hypothetical protein